MSYYSRVTDEYARFRAKVSKEEAREFIERELKCPECGFTVATAFSDASGHFKIKCQKCKTISVINFAYFYIDRFRRKRRYRKSA